MDGLDLSIQAVAGWLLLVVLFVLREIASGALKQAGEDLWTAVKRRRHEDVHEEQSNECARIGRAVASKDHTAK